MRIPTFFAAFALGGIPLLAQAGAQDAVYEEQETQLQVRLEPGEIWRQNVSFESEIASEDGGSSYWTFQYELRLRCIEQAPGGFVVVGQFVDWRLRLQKGSCGYDWQDGRYEFLSEQEEQDVEAQSACRDLLAAWSCGLRESEIRFLLRHDGTVAGLKGLEPLQETVSASLAQAGELPPEILLYFGEDGLDRANEALALALSVPRPIHQLSPGAKWNHRADVQGLAMGECRIRRNLVYTGLGRERRFRYAEIAIDPTYQMQDAAGQWQPVESSAKGEESEVVRILVDSGLLFHMTARLAFDLPDGSRATFRLSSQFGD